MIKKEAVRALRMQRQFLPETAGFEDYEALFRLASPVPTVYWTAPGDPPTLPEHSFLDDFTHNNRLRAEHKLVKGRFQSGNIGYVFREDMALYAAAYRQEGGALSEREAELLRLFREEGPMTIGVIKEITGYLVKEITPVLHKLQKKFYLFEDQTDCGGDRGWCLFEDEFPEVFTPSSFGREDAVEEIILRFLRLHVFATEAMLNAFYKLPSKLILKALAGLTAQGKIREASMDGESGYLLPEDAQTMANMQSAPEQHSVYALHRNDFLVRARQAQLEEMHWHTEFQVLQYLLIDGEFQGAVVGKFKNGPYELEDVVLALHPGEAALHSADKRREEILAAIYRVNDAEKSPLRRYCGQ